MAAQECTSTRSAFWRASECNFAAEGSRSMHPVQGGFDAARRRGEYQPWPPPLDKRLDPIQLGVRAQLASLIDFTTSLTPSMQVRRHWGAGQGEPVLTGRGSAKGDNSARATAASIRRCVSASSRSASSGFSLRNLASGSRFQKDRTSTGFQRVQRTFCRHLRSQPRLILPRPVQVQRASA